MSKLKRCPFCGDEVEIFATGLYHWKYAIHHKSKTECILDANAFALPYEEEDAVRMWNTRADRKTENSSEKPNNPTISKKEQVDKDINVRSKTEPQTGEIMTEEEFDSMLARVLTGNNEPQTEREGE